jgi:arginyl-tRNA synthetase
MNIKKHLQNKLKEAYIKCGYNFEPQVVFSARPEMCDFQSNNVFQLAKELKKNPIEVGQQIVQNIEVDLLPLHVSCFLKYGSLNLKKEKIYRHIKGFFLYVI